MLNFALNVNWKLLKEFGLLTTNYLMNWLIQGLKDSISDNIWVVYSNLLTQTLHVAIGTHTRHIATGGSSTISANDD